MSRTTTATESGTLRPLLKVAVAAGIGMAWGPVFSEVLNEILKKGWLVLASLVVGTTVVTLLAWRFVEPFMARVFGLRSDHVHQPRFGSKLFFRAYAGVLATGLALEPIVKHFTLYPQGWALSAIAVLVAGCLTFGWARGALREERRVALYGMLYGLAAGAGGGLLLGIYAHLTKESQLSLAAQIIINIIVGVIPSVLVGGAVGALIDFATRLRIGLRIALGIMGVILVYVFWVLDNARITASGYDLLFRLVLPSTFMGIGWILGILMLPGGLAALTPIRERRPPGWPFMQPGPASAHPPTPAA